MEYAQKTSNFALYKWQRDILCPAIQRLHTEKGIRLALHAPPQSGKSSILSQRGIAWLLGMDPMNRIGLACYNETHSQGFGQVVRSLMQSSDHLQLFPDERGHLPKMAPQGGFRTQARIHENDGQYSFLAMGLQSGATGKGFSHLFMDDPYKNSEEARSEVINEKVWRFWSATVGPRVSDEANVVCMFHRYVEDDLAGRLIDQGFEYIRLPILKDENEDGSDPTHYLDIREPDGRLSPYRSMAWIRAQEINDRFTFLGQFQGTPRVAGGNFFKDEWFKDYTYDSATDTYRYDGRTAPRSRCWTFQTIDPAITEKKTSAWTVVSTWTVTPDNRVLLRHVHRVRKEGPEVKDEIKNECARWNPAFIVCDASGIGNGIIQDLKKDGLPIRGVPTLTDKIANAQGGASRYQAGVVYHPKQRELGADGEDWLPIFTKELTGFPNAKWKDQVDTVSNMSRVIAQPSAVIPEFSPAQHVSPDTLPLVKDLPFACGWSFDPVPAWCIAQEESGQLRILACQLGHPGMGVYEFGTQVATFLRREFGPLDTLALNHFAVPHYCGSGTAHSPHANAGQVLALGDPSRPFSDDRPGFGWSLLPAEANRESRDEAIRIRLKEMGRSGPAFIVDPSAAELVDALSGGYAYRTLANGGMHTEPEKNVHLALVEALGSLVTSLYAVRGPALDEQDEGWLPHQYGTASGAGRRR